MFNAFGLKLLDAPLCKSPRAIGRTFRMGASLYEIVGVAPAGFTGSEPGMGIDIFVPATMHPSVTRSDASWFRPFVLLKPGVQAATVRERLLAPYQAFRAERAKGCLGMPAKATAAFLDQKLVLEPAASGNSDMLREYGGAIPLLPCLFAPRN
jgi:hypothetical protein